MLKLKFSIKRQYRWLRGFLLISLISYNVGLPCYVALNAGTGYYHNAQKL